MHSFNKYSNIYVEEYDSPKIDMVSTDVKKYIQILYTE